MRKRVILVPALTMLSAAAPRESLLEQIMAERAALGPARAAFVEQKTIRGLTQPLVSRGRLVWQPPDKIEKITDDPVQEILEASGSHLTIAESNAAAARFDLAAMPEAAVLVDAVRGTLEGDLPTLHRAFRITATGDLQNWMLMLLPRDAQVARLVNRVEVAGVDSAIRFVRVLQANGDSSLMTIQNEP